MSRILLWSVLLSHLTQHQRVSILGGAYNLEGCLQNAFKRLSAWGGGGGGRRKEEKEYQIISVCVCVCVCVIQIYLEV